MIPDQKIWDDFRKGEKYALSMIYYQHVKLLYCYSSRFSNDRELVKDTIQDLFYELARTRGNLSSTDNIRLYLLKSFRNKLLQNLKRGRNWQTIQDSVSMTSEEPSVEDELIDLELHCERDQLVHHCLQELKPRQREILFYRFNCCLSYEEICQLMSLQYGSARRLMHRSLESLRKIMGEFKIW